MCLKRLIIGCSFLIMFITVWWCFWLSCIVGPSSLAWLTCCSCVFCTCSFILCLFRGWNTVKFVFFGFGTSSLRWKYLIRLLSSVCAICCSACSVSADMISVVSSAYVNTVDCVGILKMLLMYSRKSVAESVLPCGVPSVIVCVSDCACSVWTDCCLFWKYVLKNCSVSGEKLNSCSSLWSSFLCDIVSYAFDRSM